MDEGVAPSLGQAEKHDLDVVVVEDAREQGVRLRPFEEARGQIVDLGLTSDPVPIAPARAPPDDPVFELEFGA